MCKESDSYPWKFFEGMKINHFKTESCSNECQFRFSILNPNTFQACLTFSSSHSFGFKGISERIAVAFIKGFYTFSEVDGGPGEVQLFATENI